MRWLEALRQTCEKRQPAVMATVIDASGSSPCGAGARMLVTAEAAHDTVGGGRLEQEVIAEARAMLAGKRERALHRHYPLGPDLGQCCGGAVSVYLDLIGRDEYEGWAGELLARLERDGAVRLLTDMDTGRRRVVAAEDGGKPLPGIRLHRRGRELDEEIRPERFALWLFGAGHVGSRIAQMVSVLDWRLHWVDQRPGIFPDSVGDTVVLHRPKRPELLVGDAAPGACFLVMTHSHAIDLAICEAVLRRGDFAYLGLIGSKSKRASFERHFRRKGIAQTETDRMTCPIGISAISGRRPAEIALATVAQLQMLREELLARAACENEKIAAPGRAAGGRR